MKKKIIIFIGFFLPGINSGGPVRTIHNLINAFSKDADFYIVTHFSDKNEKKQYENILLNEWNNIYSCHIFYTNMNRLNKRIIMDLCKGKDAIYVCGCYDKYSRLILSLTKKKKLNNVFIASMGNFSRGALNIKSFKKKCYFAYLKVFGLTKRIIWSVSNEIEKKQVQTIFPNSKTIVASDIPSFINDERTKKTNEENIQILFVGRISRIKNLHFALKVLSYVKAKQSFL